MARGRNRSGKSGPGGPNPVDVHVGSRVRMRRTLLGLSQEKLGEAIGLTFQQVQKYETGANRVSASRLWQLCEALNVPVSFFFEGYPEDKPSTKSRGFSESNDVLNEREALELVRAYYAHPAGFRRHILDLLKSVPKYFAPRPARRA